MTMQEDTSAKRCVSCGHEIELGDAVVEMNRGTLRRTGLTHLSRFGRAHEHCFLRVVRAPAAVLAAVERTAADTGY